MHEKTIERDEPDEESALLIKIWSQLDRAETLSTASGAMENLDEVAKCCEEVVADVRAWQARHRRGKA